MSAPVTANPTPVHWHAFCYTGKGYTDSEVGKGLAPFNFPPVEVKHWLLRLPGMRTPAGAPIPESALPVQLFRESEIDEAISWLDKELHEQEPLDAESFPIAVRLEYSRARMMERVQRDVVYGYWSKRGLYVARVLKECTRTTQACR